MKPTGLRPITFRTARFLLATALSLSTLFLILHPAQAMPPVCQRALDDMSAPGAQATNAACGLCALATTKGFTQKPSLDRPEDYPLIERCVAEKLAGTQFDRQAAGKQNNDSTCVKIGERGIRYADESKWSLALTDLNRAIRQDPTCARAIWGRGTVYLNIGGDPLNKKILDEAIEDFSKYITLPSDGVDRTVRLSGAFAARGIIRLRYGEFELAYTDCNKAIDINSTYASGFLCRGLAEKKLGRLDTAERDIQTAKRLDPKIDQ